MLTNEEHELRRTGIGGTDIAAILGRSPYKSALGVYLDKKGLNPPFATTPAQEFGLEQEDFILRKYAQMEKCKLTPNPGFKRHATIPYLVANVDAIRDDRIVVDAKNIGLYGDKGEYAYKAWGEPYSDQMPQHYLFQIAHYCLVLDFQEGHMVPYFGGSDLRVYVYKRNTQIDKLICQAAQRFWEDHILADKPPIEKGTYQEITRLWKTVKNEECITASPPIEDLIKELRDIRTLSEELKVKEDTLRSHVASFMEDKAILTHPNGHILASWKEETRQRFDLEAFKTEEAELYQHYLKPTVTRSFRLRKGE